MRVRPCDVLDAGEGGGVVIAPTAEAFAVVVRYVRELEEASALLLTMVDDARAARVPALFAACRRLEHAIGARALLR